MDYTDLYEIYKAFRNYRLYDTNLFFYEILMSKALIINIYEILKIL